MVKLNIPLMSLVIMKSVAAFDGTFPVSLQDMGDQSYTYQLAKETCESLSVDSFGTFWGLCSQDQLCDEHNYPAPADAWMPISDSYNEWLSVGNNDMQNRFCKTHSQVVNFKPAWGTKHQHLSWKPRQIMCCSSDRDSRRWHSGNLIHMDYGLNGMACDSAKAVPNTITGGQYVGGCASDHCDPSTKTCATKTEWRYVCGTNEDTPSCRKCYDAADCRQEGYSVNRDKDQEDLVSCPAGFNFEKYEKYDQNWPAADVYAKVCTTANTAAATVAVYKVCGTDGCLDCSTTHECRLLGFGLDRDKDVEDLRACPFGYRYTTKIEYDQIWPAADVYLRLCKANKY